MNAVDTNVLVYVHDPRDARKQRRAIQVVEQLADGVMLWQVACEYLAASRKLAAFGFSRATAWQDIQDYLDDWQLALPNREVLQRATRLMDTHSLSFWDAMIVAACAEAGVTRLYSEDITGYPSLDGVELVNPFLAALS